MEILVNNSQGLSAAIRSVQAGDTIKLAPGTYSDVVIYNIKIPGNVTITSADPSHQAVLSGLTVNGANGFTFKGLEFYVDPAKYDGAYQVFGSSNINFDHINMHGSLDGNPKNDHTGLTFQSVKNVSVTNSEFQQVSFGVIHQNSDGVTVSNNYFHDIRSDGVRGGGSSHVTITDNHFRDFYPNEADHPDAIQFWTTNAVSSATDIVVTGNVVMRGAGAPTQGIFFRDEQEIYPYKNVTVADNIVIGASYNAITVNHAENLTITNNTVVGLVDQKSWISVGTSTGVTVTGNQATDYAYANSTNTGLSEGGNIKLAYASDGGKAALDAYLAAHSTDTALVSTVTSNFATAANLSVKAIDTVIAQVVTRTGGDGADVLAADAAKSSLLQGGGGADSLIGGGLGNNTLIGGAGNDTYYVRSSRDTVVEQNEGGADLVVASVDQTLGANVENLRMVDNALVGTGNSLANRIQGQGGNETITGLGGNDTLQGEAGNDLVSGGDGDDYVYLGAGDDTGSGGEGVDYMTGGAGNDSLAGGGGKDTIQGELGADTMSGGLSGDVFAFNNGDLGTTVTDHIVDFSSAQGDKLAMGGIDANTTRTGDQAFTFIGTAGFHKVAGELRFEVVGGSTCLMGDTNGDGVADLKLWLDGVKSISSGDIWL